MLRTIWGDNERYLRTYWEKFQNRYYVAGDSARRDKDGYYWIMGRIDDVLNVAGHRLGTMEIESALVAHRLVAEAAVVSKPHEIKGESVFAYVVLNVQRPQGAAANSLIEELRGWVGEQLSPIAKPDEIRLTDNLPKTRSGKIMRRLLRSIARGEEITADMSTLENPGILEQLRGAPAGAPTATRTARPKRKVAAKKAARKGGVRAAGKSKIMAKRAMRKVAAAKSRKPAKSGKPARKAKPGKARAKK
jgi:acetyl-CoA synthetase